MIEDLASRGDSSVITGYEPTTHSFTTEGSSKTDRFKNYANIYRMSALQSSSRRLSSTSDTWPAIPLLPRVPLSSQSSPIKSIARAKSTTSNKSSQLVSSLKPYRPLPSPGPLKPLNSSSKLGQRLAAGKSTPSKPKKIPILIPAAKSAETVRREEEERRRQQELAERQKADALWQEKVILLKEMVDKKFNSVFETMERHSQNHERLMADVKSVHRNWEAYRRSMRRKLQELLDAKDRTRADIKSTNREILRAESDLKYLNEQRRWLDFENRMTRLDEQHIALKKLSSSHQLFLIPSAVAQFNRGSLLMKVSSRQLTSNLLETANHMATFAHTWRHYRRLRLFIDYCPVPAAFAFEISLMPVFDKAESLLKSATDMENLIYIIIHDRKVKNPKTWNDKTVALSALSRNITQTSRQILNLINRESMLFGSTFSRPGFRSTLRLRLSRWQRLTWRPFMLERLMDSDLKRDLWNYCDEYHAQNKELNDALRKLDKIRGEYRQALSSCIIASWARASIDIAHRVLPTTIVGPNSDSLTPRHNSKSENHQYNGLTSYLTSQTQRLNESQSYWQFSHSRGSDGKKITLHLCTSQLSSERVAELFLRDGVLGFDLEWRMNAPPSHPDNVALLQLANEEQIALFHLAVMHKTSGSDTVDTKANHLNRIGPVLRSVLENRNILKTGVAIKADSTRLAKIYCVDMAGIFELSHLYRQLEHKAGDKTPIPRKLVSLSKQSEKHLGLPLAKGDERCSSWHLPLTREQMTCMMSFPFCSELLLIMFQTQLMMSMHPSCYIK